MVALEERLSTNIRQELVDTLKDELTKRLYAKTTDRTVAVDEPDRGEDPEDWSVLPVITRRQWTDAVFEVFDEPLPPANDTTAEVRTPATVLVWAFCPRCKLPAAIRLHVEPVLTIDSNGSSLKLKSSSKATYHVCGQQTLPRPVGVAEGQLEVVSDEGEDLDGEADMGEADAQLALEGDIGADQEAEDDAVHRLATVPPRDDVQEAPTEDLEVVVHVTGSLPEPPGDEVPSDTPMATEDDAASDDLDSLPF